MRRDDRHRGGSGWIWLSFIACGIGVFLLGKSVPGQVSRGPGSCWLSWGAKLSAFFIENRGVHDERVKYYVEHGEGLVLFEEGGVVLRPVEAGQRDVRIAFVGARKGVAVRGIEPRPTVVSYFSGPEAEWKRGLPTFGAIMYSGLWPGIDLLFRGERGALKYEFRVAPGADASLVRLRYEGAEAVEIAEDGALCVRTGGATLRDPRPVAWQTIDAARRPVEARFRVLSACECLVGFDVGSYDPGHELVIDPAMLLYCGYAGPTRNRLTDIAVDASGNAYLLGLDFDPNRSGHDGIRVMKVSPDGSRLDYVTIINAANVEGGGGIAVDAQGSVYVAGATNSDETSFPVKVGPSLKMNKGPYPVDGFILKLAPGGTSIVYCGYLGGSRSDGGSAVAVDVSGAAWVIGGTSSMDLPVMGGPLLKKPVPSTYEAFVAKVKPDGSGLLVSGYLGGNWDDYGSDIAVDPRGDAYVCGMTQSTDLPVKMGPGLTYGGGHNTGFDGFVAKIDGQTGLLHYCGYVGGSGDDQAQGIDVDASGNAYICGYTASNTQSFPVKIGPFLQGTSGFVAKVDPTGKGNVYCGRIPDGIGSDIAVDGAGSAYIAGKSWSGKVPVNNGPNSTFSGNGDAFVAKVPPTGVGFSWAGYIGGNGFDYADAIALDALGSVYVVGGTTSDQKTFPVKVGPGLRYNGGPLNSNQYGAFVAKVVEPTLWPSGTGRIGTTVAWSLSAAWVSGLPYQAGTSLGSGPIWIGNRRLDLSPDDLLAVSVQGLWPHVFQGYSGLLDVKGQAAAKIVIPSFPALAGNTLHTAFVVFDSSASQGVHAVSHAVPVSIVP